MLEKTSKVAYAIFRKEQGQWAHFNHLIVERTDLPGNRYARRFVGPYSNQDGYKVCILPVWRVG